MLRLARFVFIGWLFLFQLSLSDVDEIDQNLKTIAAVGPQGSGSSAARRASDTLAQHGVIILPRLLKAMDTPNIVAANWYRTVYHQIVNRELAKATPAFPLEQLQQYVRDSSREGRVRRLVLALLDEIDSDFRRQLLAELLDDPEFRDDAVDLVLKSGNLAKKEGNVSLARREFEKAFAHSRNSRQVQQAASGLRSLGMEVNIIEHLGFLTRWYLLGPFDAPETSGFDLAFPPEEEVDLTASYSGKDGTSISWKLHETDDTLGQLNLIHAIAPVKEAVGYAYTEFISRSNQEVELRCGADDNITVWLNGEKILAKRQWLNGIRLDRFLAPAKLLKGKNTVLVKICQGPKHKNPAVPNNWSMQLRFCDSSGAAVGLKTTLPQPAKQ